MFAINLVFFICCYARYPLLLPILNHSFFIILNKIIMKKPLFLVARAATPTRFSVFFSRVLSFGRTAMLLFLIICAICGSGQDTNGQESSSFCGVITKPPLSNWQLGNEIYYDRFNNAYTLNELIIKRSALLGSPCVDDGFFDLVFEEDANATWTLTEQATICEVFSYLSSIMPPTSVNIP